jgi:hypothetical protein
MLKNLLYQSKIIKSSKMLAFSVLLMANFSLIYSQSQIGGGSEIYLTRDYGARALSLAGAYSAISDDPSTILYNPAGLGFYRFEPTVSIYSGTLGLGRTASFLGYAQQINQEFGIGLGVNGLYTGSFMGRDEFAEPTGELSNFQYTFIASGAYRIEFASVGISLKYLTNNLIGSYTIGSGVSIDAGTKFNIMDLFSFSLAVRNLYGTMMWNTLESNRETIPFEIRSGVAMQFGLNSETTQNRSTITGEIEDYVLPPTRYILISLEGSFIENSKTPSVLVGLEVAADEFITFRGGLDVFGEKYGTRQFAPLNKWGAGVSVKPDLTALFDNIPFTTSLDYTVTNEFLSPNKIAHHLSFTFVFE